ncbi:MAG: MFS transporter [Bryobacteraceae bacterium]
MQVNPPVPEAPPYDAARLFTGSCVALVVIGLTFAIRGDIIGALGTQFQLTHEQLGWIAGAAFWGYVLSILIAGQLCDVLGMRRLLGLACIGHSAGIVLTIFAGGFWSLWLATLGIGIANALLEAAINPLVATIYPDQKTQKLNAVHAWFPWGIVIGGFLAYGLTRLEMGWQIKMAMVLVPTIAYGLIYFGQKFPVTERIQHGVRTSEMYREAIRPRFLVLLFCMLLTASTELGPNQWIPDILTKTAHFPGILILAWINSIMAIGRMLAVPVVRRLSPVGLLLAAATLSAVGLLGLSLTESGAGALAASTVFAFGVCYFWPTMLGVTSEWFPAGGALLLAIIGGAGNLSVALILPVMGRIYDVEGSQLALRYVAILPVALIGIFGMTWILDRAKGGHQSVRLAAGANSTGLTSGSQ